MKNEHNEKSGEVVVPCRFGMHLGVAVKVVMAARSLKSVVWIIQGDRRSDAKSIFGLVAIGASRGKKLTLLAKGPDADGAIQRLTALFSDRGTLCEESDS